MFNKFFKSSMKGECRSDENNFGGETDATEHMRHTAFTLSSIDDITNKSTSETLLKVTENV